MLVSALAGKDNILNAYRVAVEEKYRFFSFWGCYDYLLNLTHIYILFDLFVL